MLIMSSLFAQQQNSNSRHTRHVLRRTSLHDLYEELNLRSISIDGFIGLRRDRIISLSTRRRLSEISNNQIYNEIISKQISILKKQDGSNYSDVNTIYGVDNRKDLYEINDFNIVKNARSTCCLVNNSDILYNGISYYVNCSPTDYCPNIRFYDQKKLAKCTAFAIAPDIIVTAGHCISEDELSSTSILYEFNISEKNSKINTIVQRENIYKIKEILEMGNLSKGLDYAILRIDRPVNNNRILSIRRTGKIPDKSVLYVVGYPDGLPLKVSSDGIIRNNRKKNTLIANLDTFKGNSGSPVFNAATHEVEGILTAGDEDFYWVEQQQCKNLYVCREIDCKGETIVRITALLPRIKKYLNN